MWPISACRFNPAMREFYQRLLQPRKRKKVAITAFRRKLLTILKAVLKYQQPWAYNPVCP
jgi:hypothetical protein